MGDSLYEKKANYFSDHMKKARFYAAFLDALKNLFLGDD